MKEISLTEPQELFLNLDKKYPLFVAGFGSGKSTALTVSVLMDLEFEGVSIGCYAPTYDLLKLITIPYLEDFLMEMDVPYKINKSDYIIEIEGGNKIILRSIDRPQRIVGYEVFRSHIDEIDTVPQAQATGAWNKIIARNRQKVFILDHAGNKIPLIDEAGNPILKNDKIQFETFDNRVSAYTTPEGFNFAYDRWVKKGTESYGFVKASTYSNEANLPDDYISSLLETYPPELAEAYLNGEFVNLTSGSVYPNFDRELNNSSETVNGEEPLYIGCDFNVMFGASSIHVMRGDDLHAVDEISEAFDTDVQIAIIKERYPNNPINIYPDATGKRRVSSNTSETDLQKLYAAKFSVHVNHANPLIKDRVANVNAKVCNGKYERHYFVNVEKCPQLTNCLEQQVYDSNGVPDKSNNLDHLPDGVGYLITKVCPIDKQELKSKAVRRGY